MRKLVGERPAPAGAGRSIVAIGVRVNAGRFANRDMRSGSRIGVLFHPVAVEA